MSDTRWFLPRLFAEMKRRKVFRVMAVYGATAFVLLQVADLLAEGMGLSDQVLRVTTFLVVVGFPIAVVLAWAFETTPEGVRRTADAAPEEISAILAQPASRRWPAGLLALAGVALLFAGWWMGRQGRPSTPLNLAVPQAEAAEFSRIAVLPFEDLGGNEENDPFLAGIHVDIHGKLEGLADLRVTSLGSAQNYRGSDKTTREIASDLGVDFLLRGSVRRAGDQARVNVQLTDVRIGEDIWAEEYDREVTVANLFAIQSEIARRVADRLEATLSPEDIEQLATGLSTDNMAALNAYHRARSIMARAGFFETGSVLLDHLVHAVELAPEFVEAWSVLAWTLSDWSEAATDSMAVRALEAVERAEVLAPGSIEATKARGWYTYYVQDDFERALEWFRAAESEAPSDIDVLTGIGLLQHRLGDFAGGTQTAKRAAALDPQNPATLRFLALMLSRMSRWEAADVVVERILALDPSTVWARQVKVGIILQGDRDPARALGLAAEFGLEPSTQLAWYATLDRDYAAAAEMIASATNEDRVATFEMGRLRLAEWIETLRRGSPELFRDSLVILMEANPFLLESQKDIAAEVMLARGQTEGWTLLDEHIAEARSSDDQADRIDAFWRAATIAARFGRTDLALGLLDEAVAMPSDNVWSVADLELDPIFDSIRDDIRFDDLIARQQAYEDEQARLAEAEGPWLP